MPLLEGIEVEGLRDLDRALHELNRGVQVALNKGLRHAAEPARTRMEELAATKISGMARQRTVDWSQMRIGGGTALIYVAPLQRGRGSRANRGLRRPKLARLLLTKAMEPGLHQTERQITPIVEREVEKAIRAAGFEMRGLFIPLIGDPSSLLKSFKQAEDAADKFSAGLTKSTDIQVQAALKRDARLRQEVVEYKRVAAAAQKGSREQVVAANLAAQSEARLARSLGVTERETRKLRSSSRGLERDLSSAARGALSGSGLFRSFGRTLAFASGGFLVFHEASDFIRESINAAREAIVAQRSLAAQMKASGESFSANREQIDKVSLSYGKFGFQNDEVIASLTVLERGTGNINKAIGLQGLTADLARAKNLELAKAANVVAKVFGGQETALRRAVPGLEKNAHGWELIRQAQAKLAGQAAANTTASDKFAATLHNTEEIVGGVLLPTLNKYLESLSAWLNRMNESGKLQKDLATASHVLSDAVGVVKGAFDALNAITGSTKRSIEALLIVMATFKTLKIAESVLAIGTSLGRVGTSAEASATKVGVLRGKLLSLVANPYTVVIAVTAIGAEVVARKIADLQKKMLDAQAQTFKQGDPVETILVPRLARQIESLRKAGESYADILKQLRAQLGGGLKADDLIAEALSFSSGSDPKLRARIQAQVRKRAGGRGGAADAGPPGRTGFNVRMARLDLALAKAELTANQKDNRAILVQEAALVRERLTKVKSLKDRTALYQQLGQIQSQISGIDEQAASNQEKARQKELDARRKAADAAIRQAEKIKALQVRAEARQTAAQFRQLGFGPGGADLIPSGRELLKRLGKIKDQVKGTVLDTGENRKLLARIRETLVGGLGKLAPEVRQKIQELLDALDIEDAAKKRGKPKNLLGMGFRPPLLYNNNPFPWRGQPRPLNVSFDVDGATVANAVVNPLAQQASRAPVSRRGSFAGSTVTVA